MKQLPHSNKCRFNNTIAEFNNIQLADPLYNRANSIQMLLGIELWANIVQGHVFESDTGLRAQNTEFRYVVFGSIEQCEEFNTNMTSLHTIIEEENVCLIITKKLQHEIMKGVI